MSKIRIEAFLSNTTPNSDRLVELLNIIQTEYDGKIEIISYRERNEKFDELNLTAFPAVVVEGIVKIMGFCPSKESLISALREVGME